MAEKGHLLLPICYVATSATGRKRLRTANIPEDRIVYRDTDTVVYYPPGMEMSTIQEDKLAEQGDFCGPK